MPSEIAWEQLSQLHVVRNVAKLLGRRWHLGLGFASAEGAEPPHESEFASARIPCPLIQGHQAGMAACVTSSLALWRQAQSSTGSTVCARACHAGLVELGAPVRVRGKLVGVLVCGGFLRGETPRTVTPADLDLERLELPKNALSSAVGAVPVLSASDESFIGELITGAADDVAAFLSARQSRQAASAEPELRTRFEDIVGRSTPMQALYSLLDRVVASDTTILVQGENGTGKELVARAIHRLSPRRDQRFVVQNCSAFNDNLLDSELFGHRRGAFTGAVSDKAGLFEVADGGTFFLDEIGDMSPALQVKVLRVLQEGTFTPVGDTVEKQVDVRIIAATNRDLKAMVASGAFREDLYYRINVINLVVPPLRQRRGDVEILARHFLDHYGRDTAKELDAEALRRLESYAWPGNVRELQNEIERAVVLSGERSLIGAPDLSERIRGAAPSAPAEEDFDNMGLPEAIEALERRMILAALRRNRWNKTRAAAELSISRRNLIRLVQKYSLESLRP